MFLEFLARDRLPFDDVFKMLGPNSDGFVSKEALDQYLRLTSNCEMSTFLLWLQSAAEDAAVGSPLELMHRNLCLEFREKVKDLRSQLVESEKVFHNLKI